MGWDKKTANRGWFEINSNKILDDSHRLRKMLECEAF